MSRVHLTVRKTNTFYEAVFRLDKQEVVVQLEKQDDLMLSRLIAISRELFNYEVHFILTRNTNGCWSTHQEHRSWTFSANMDVFLERIYQLAIHQVLET